MHLTVRQTLSRAHTHTSGHTRQTPECHETAPGLWMSSRHLPLFYYATIKSWNTSSLKARVSVLRELSPSQITAYSTAEPPTLSSLPPLALLSLSLLRLPHCFFSLSLPFSLFLSPSLIDSPFPSAALLPLVMRIVSDIFRWMEPLVDSEGMGYTAGTVFLLK